MTAVRTATPPSTAAVPSRSPRRRTRRRPWGAGAVISVVLLGSLLPLYWMVATALKPTTEQAAIPATLWPHEMTLEQFGAVFENGTIPAASVRSLGIAVATTIAVVVLGSLSAYAATHLRFRASSSLLSMSFVTQLLPQAATLVPVFIMWRQLGLMDSLPGITLVYVAFQLPVAVWIITGHFASVPREVVEAASVDGARPLTTLFRIVVPMAAPGVAAVAIWCVIGVWSELLFALVLLSSNNQTVPVALASVIGQHTTNWGYLLAAASIASLPPLLLFFLLQKYFADGISGAVKG
ncbi:binding-protein-dependent transport systems inner membrane component [Beutenbergia cavernae DSM 12333]|uniref:Binding-protein-dependent transport systems inner membrane component n=1 Tax=Beutenbergia cavernae (strain ATCC BAA-8 / DSM 12333 / CCUG 43141 / JCM 11478 / NBRC 16432 / NCIMB 13614 / HKI 0122) TaxID=471853 RepID=C5C3P7_BEUC1|nr:carbohydrate ABC transporter permease [Beutenbergia cavernae]ACQ81956.1 binding-protein-dependent transport systems inner membrane component [Beutenbergia cavernae DSM 12333]